MSSDESSASALYDDASSWASDDSRETSVEEGLELASQARDYEEAAQEDEPAAAADALQAWYEDEIQSLRLTTYSVAHKLVTDDEDVPFEAAVRALDQVLDMVVTKQTAAQRQGDVLGSTQPQFFLTVKGDSLQVVYGVRLCHLLQNRVVAIMGDRRRSNNIMREPNVMVVEGEAQTQTRVFGCIKIAAKEMSVIRDELAEMEEGNYTVGRLAVGPKLRTPKLLPVHPKMAALFLRGVKIPKALELLQGLTGQFSEDIDLLLTPLIHFCRAAATVHGGKSAVAIDWAPVQLGESEPLDDWCSGLISQWIPRHDSGKPAARVGRDRYDHDPQDNTTRMIRAVHNFSRAQRALIESKKRETNQVRRTSVGDLLGGNGRLG